MLGLAAIMMLLLLLLLLLSALSGGENSLKDFKNPFPSSLLSLATTEFCFFPRRQKEDAQVGILCCVLCWKRGGTRALTRSQAGNGGRRQTCPLVNRK